MPRPRPVTTTVALFNRNLWRAFRREGLQIKIRAESLWVSPTISKGRASSPARGICWRNIIRANSRTSSSHQDRWSGDSRNRRRRLLCPRSGITRSRLRPLRLSYSRYTKSRCTIKPLPNISRIIIEPPLILIRSRRIQIKELRGMRGPNQGITTKHWNKLN